MRTAEVILVISAVASVGSAIRCYECNSANNSICLKDKLPASLKKDCSEYQRGVTYTMCRKIVQNVEFSVDGQLLNARVIRTCGWEDSKYKNTCYVRSGYGSRQEVCSCLTDDCNSASTVGSVFALIVTILGIHVC